MNVVLSLPVKAQFPNPTLFNTATNASGTGTIPVGTNDINWSAALSTSVGPYVQAVSCGNQAPGNWINSPFPNANWISYPHNCTPGSPAEHACIPGHMDVFYKLTFNLPATICGQNVSTPNAYCLSLDIYADNSVFQIFVNGVSAYLNPSTNPYYDWGYSASGGKSISLCSNWQPGTNSVILHVRSGQNPSPTWEALLVQANQSLNPNFNNPITMTVSSTNISCTPGATGSATVLASGGNGIYSYTWQPSGGNGPVAQNLGQGIYTVAVSSGSSCVATQTLNISQPAPFSIAVPPGVTGCSGGPVAVAASGANTYTWNTGANSASISVSSAGIYTVSGTNSSGCTNSQTVSVSFNAPPSLSLSGTQSVCPGGSAVISASGANSYTWNTGAQSASISVSPQVSTVYTVSGNAQNNSCVGSGTIAVNVLSTPIISISGNSPVCLGSPLTLNASGASTYTWSNGNNGSSVNLLPAVSGTFSVTGQNSAGCAGTTVVTVTVNSLPTISANSATACVGQTAFLSASGANTYTWSGGQTGPVISVSSAGIYTVVGTATASGCTGTATAQVIFQSLPVVTVSGNFTICEGQTSTIFANGASNYSWSNGVTGTSVTIMPLVSGQYSVSGTDNSTGCSNTQTFAVLVYQKPQILVSGNLMLCGPGTLTLSASGADSYTWSTGANTSTISINTSGTQSFLVSGSSAVSGCTNTAISEVTVSNVPNLSVANVTVCAGHATTLSVHGANSYLWSNGATGNTIVVNPVATQIFTVTGYGLSTQCSDSKSISLTVLPAPILSITSPTVICERDYATLTVSGFSSFLWNTGDTAASIIVNPQHTTTYSVTSYEVSSGCVSSASVTVKVNPLPFVKIMGDREACEGEYITLKAEGAHIYSWEGLITQSVSIYVQENQQYTVIGTDLTSGCKNSDTIRVGTSPKCCEVFVPNTFTPDEDGLNDGFGAKTECKFKEFQLYIFDKWGEQIFSGNTVHSTWNGYFKGKLCEQDVYVYLIRGLRSEVGAKQKFEKTGHVLLLTK